MVNLAPIVLFTYRRLDTLELTISALQKNYLAPNSDLYIFSDAARGESDKQGVTAVREYLNSINGFKTITVLESPVNKGLATSIIEGVSQILKTYESVIVLEDDLVSTPNFLDFMNQALHFYKETENVFSITGFSIPINCGQSVSDVYFTLRSSSWGWAIWRDRWLEIDWKVGDYSEFKKNTKSRRDFNKMGSDMTNMLDRQMQGQLNSWAIRWCYHQFKHDLFSVHPFVSKINNVGFNSPDASNTKERFNRYQTKLDKGENIKFLFSNDISLNQKIISQFTRPFTIKKRLQYKLLNLLFKN